MFELKYSEETSEKILKALLNAGKIKEEDLVPDENNQPSWATNLKSLIYSKRIAEDWLVSLMSKNASLTRAFPEKEKIQVEALSILPLALLSRHSILPYRLDDNVLKVLILDPNGKKILNSTLRESHRQEVVFEITSLSHLEMLYRVELVKNSINALVEQPKTPDKDASDIHPNEAKNEIKEEAEPQKEKFEPRSDIKKLKKEAPLRKFKFRDKWQASDPDLVIDFCAQILMEAIVNEASDIHIESFRDLAQIRMRVDGSMSVKKSYSDYLYKNYPSVIARFKIMADCDISERRLPQDGAITFKGPRSEDIDFRFSILPTKNGERIVMRILAGDPALSLDKIGFDKNDYLKIIDAIEAPQGMVLVTGPTGSGKTTTLYGALQHINKPGINILTAEDPVEYYLEGAGQVQANEKIGLTFSNILRAFLRQDPEVILVGEIRDQETIDIAIKAALTGHLLLSTLHTNDSIATITRIQNMGVPNFMISSALTIIVAQRLAKKNCQVCLEDDPRATKENLLKIGFSANDAIKIKAKRGSGCKVCGGSGLKGRQGIYEVLRMTKEIEEAILQNAQAPQILIAARKDGFRTMQEIAREFVEQGILSIEEFQSCLNLTS